MSDLAVLLGKEAVANLYVATNGSDASNGSLHAPYATIDKAREVVQSMQPLDTPVEVYLRGGTYRESVSFDMRDDSALPVTYQSYAGEEAVVSGAELVTGTWSVHSGSIQKVSIPGQAKFLSLFVNGKMAIRARFPDQGDFHVCQQFAEDLPTKVYVYDHILFDTTYGIPAGIDPANEDIEITFYDEYIIHKHPYGSSDVDSIYFKDGGLSDVPLNRLVDYGRYFWENSLSFLTAPGEWYWDHVGETLYYYPLPGEEDLSIIDVELSTTDSAFVLRGENSTIPAMAGDFTFACNFKTPSMTQTRQGILTNRHLLPDSSESFEVKLMNEGTKGVIRVIYGGEHTDIVGTPGLDDDNWHALLVACDKATGVVTTFVDEVQIDQSTFTPPASIYTGIPWFARTTSGGQYWEGELDSLLFLDKTITDPVEVAEIASLDRTYPTLAGNIVFNLPLMGDFNVDCETVVAVCHKEIQGDLYGAEQPFSNDPQFIDGGAGHNPTCYFESSKGADMIGPKVSYLADKMPGKQLRNVHFKDLRLTGFARQAPDMKWCVIDSSRNVLVKSAVDALYVKDCSVINCEISECGGDGVLYDVSENCKVTDCAIYNIGGTGVLADSVRYVIADRPWGNHDVSRNEIHDIGSIVVDTNAIASWHLPSYTMNYNRIWNIPKVGIKPFQELNSVDFELGVIEIAYNTVRNVCTDVPDAGGIHTAGYVPLGHIHHNHIKDVLLTYQLTDYRRDDQEGEDLYTAIKGMYFDLGSSGWRCDFNKIYRCDAGPMYMLRCGPELIIENNICVDAPNSNYGSFVNTMTNSKFGGDGTVNQYPKGNTVQKNVFYTATGNTPIKYRFLNEAFDDGDAPFNDPGMIPRPFDDQDLNCYWPDVFWHTYERYTIDNEWALAELQSRYLSDVDSISEDPQFVDYDNDDFTVQNANVLALGFVNFEVPAF